MSSAHSNRVPCKTFDVFFVRFFFPRAQGTAGKLKLNPPLPVIPAVRLLIHDF